MSLASRRGVTLIEMLIAMALTLLLMAGTITVFGVVTSGIAGSRVIIESSERLRAARNRLQADLAGATVIPVPPRRPEADEGYLEYIEGPLRDSMFNATAKNNLMGDCDDVLALTVRSRGEPFVGRVLGPAGVTTIQSQVAEVTWFALPNGQSIVSDTAADRPVQLYTLYRRVRLVLPQMAPFDLLGRLEDYDLSGRMVQIGRRTQLVPNTLGDLTKPENRWGHGTLSTTAFDRPFVFGEPFEDLNANGVWDSGEPFTNLDGSVDASGNPTYTSPPRSITGLCMPFTDASGRLGDDVVLTNVVGWDIQAFDPLAPLMLAADGQTVLVPSDPGYDAATLRNKPNLIVSRGAYIDLNYDPGGGPPLAGLSPLAGLPQPKSGLSRVPPPLGIPVGPPTYDTWSMHYEQEELFKYPEPAVGAAASTRPNGVNGLDDNGDGVVDDENEWQTGPPYPVPLRGLQIRIRVYEPDSQQVRSVTVVQDFLAE